MVKCKCSFVTSLVGDGCEICNPQLAKYYEEEQQAINQCDGCCQDLPLVDGIHWKDDLPWICCTADRYNHDNVDRT